MNEARIDRLEDALASIRPEGRPIPGDTRQMLLDCLPAMCSEAFGHGDRRADPAYLAALDLPSLIVIWEQALTAQSAADDSPQWQAFERLSLEERIRIASDPQPIALSLERLCP